MKDDDSAVVAAWLSVGINFLTLVVTVAAVAVGSVALLSVDGVRWMLCRNTGYECGFEGIHDDLLTFDADPIKSQNLPASPPPPGIVDSKTQPFEDEGLRSSAWALLAAQVDASTYAGSSDNAPLAAEDGCLSLDSLTSELDQARARSDNVYGLIGDNWRWKVNYVRGPVDEGIIPPGSNPTPRTLVVEVHAHYGQLPHSVELYVHLSAYAVGTLEMSVFPTLTRNFTINLSSGSYGIEFLCPIPDLPVGQYDLIVQTNGFVGDWQSKMDPLPLTVKSLTQPRYNMVIPSFDAP
jgi:hypothetical protein